MRTTEGLFISGDQPISEVEHSYKYGDILSLHDRLDISWDRLHKVLYWLGHFSLHVAGMYLCQKITQYVSYLLIICLCEDVP